MGNIYASASCRPRKDSFVAHKADMVTRPTRSTVGAADEEEGTVPATKTRPARSTVAAETQEEEEDKAVTETLSARSTATTAAKKEDTATTASTRPLRSAAAAAAKKDGRTANRIQGAKVRSQSMVTKGMVTKGTGTANRIQGAKVGNRLLLPCVRLYDVVLLQRFLLPYKYRNMLGMTFQLIVRLSCAI